MAGNGRFWPGQGQWVHCCLLCVVLAWSISPSPLPVRGRTDHSCMDRELWWSTTGRKPAPSRSGLVTDGCCSRLHPSQSKGRVLKLSSPSLHYVRRRGGLLCEEAPRSHTPRPVHCAFAFAP